MKFVLIGIFALAFNGSAFAAGFNCKADSYVSCSGKECSKEETFSVEFSLTGKLVSLGMYSVLAENRAATNVKKKNGTGFLFEAVAKTASGDELTSIGSGFMNHDSAFDALIDGVHYSWR